MSKETYPPGDYKVVVVGTGPGGLQLSSELRRIGVHHALISQDEGPGGMFRRFPLFHRLNTSSRRFCVVPRDSMAFYRYDWNSLVTDVPEQRALVPEFMDGLHYFPRRSEMADALGAFADRAGVEARYGCRWESTREEGGRFVLGTTDGEYRCDIAVFAVGMSEPWRPPTPGLELVPHYDDLQGRDAESFQGQRVFIVGKRNSAFEIADELLPWAAQIVLGSPHHVRPSIVTGVPTPPRARYLEVFEDHCFGGGSFVVDCAIERIERNGDGWRVHTEGTTEPGTMVFDVDEVIATTGFGTPLGDLRELGVTTFYKDRLPTQTPFWESSTVPGIFFAGAATQGQVGLRKYGFPNGSASVGGFRYNAVVQAVEIGRRLGIEPERPQLSEDEVVPFLLEQATNEGALWRQPAHLARIVSFDSREGIRDEGILPVTPFVDSAGPPAAALIVETDPEGKLQLCVYVRRNGRVSEHLLPPAFMHDFRTPEHRAELESLLSGLPRAGRVILPPEDEVRRLYAESKTIAVVGCSGQWPKPSHVVPAYMQVEGYRILPVNPGEDQLLGEPCVASLEDVSEPVDIVNVFRPAPEVPAIASAAVAIGAGCLWIQNGIVSLEAVRIAGEAGLMVVMDCCIGILHGDLGLGIGVTEWKAAREASWQ